MQRDLLGRGSLRRSSKTYGFSTLRDLPRTRLRGGDTLRGGRLPAAGHAGRAAYSLAYRTRLMGACLATVVLIAFVALFSCTDLPAFAAATTATVTSRKSSPPVYDQFTLTSGGKDYLAYCAEAVNEAPDTGTAYTLYSGTIDIPQLDYVCYHGYDGKTVTNLASPSGQQLDARSSRAATQAAVWLAIGERRLDIFHYRVRTHYHTNDDFNVSYQVNRLTATELATAQALVAQAEAYAAQDAATLAASPEAGYAKLYQSSALDSDNDNYVQRLILIGEKGGQVRLTKRSTLPLVTEDNACYVLGGAEYGLYGDSDCTVLVGTLMTAADGTVLSDLVAPGTYWLKETSAPQGYLADASAHQLVVSGGTTGITVPETPLHAQGVVALQKVDADGCEVSEERSTTPQGDAHLSGAHFLVSHYAEYAEEEGALTSQPLRSWTFETDEEGLLVLDEDHRVAGDELYLDADGQTILPLGTYIMREVSAPEGYVLGEMEPLMAQVVEDSTSDTGSSWRPVGSWPSCLTAASAEGRGIANAVKRGGVRVGKVDQDLQRHAAQGDASLDATFAITLLSEQPVLVGDTTYLPGQTVLTLVADAETGEAQTGTDALPYGTYRVTESLPPEGYLADESWYRDFAIREQGVVVDLSSAADSVADHVVRGGVTIAKVDGELDENVSQGDATLAGATFAIVLESDQPVWVDGTLFETGEVVQTIVTDDAGRAATSRDALPYGTYRVVETVAPRGYLLDKGWERTFSVRNGHELVDLTSDALPEQVIRGGVMVQKVDAQNGRSLPQGAASLCGAEFSLTLESPHDVWVDGVRHAQGEVVATLVTDEEGCARTDTDALPYGTYTIRETKAPEGYLLNNEWSRTFAIREEGEVWSYTAASEPADPQPELVVRGDLEGVKVVEENMARLAGVPFVIESLTTGEWHVIVTDANGQLSTASSWNPHTQATNANDASVEVADEGFRAVEGAEFDADAGVWFHGRTDIETMSVSDGVGALPYDRYRIVEVPCAANEGLQLLDVEVAMSHDARTVDLGTLDNRPLPPQPILTTTLTGAGGAHVAAAHDEVTLVDEVCCYNLVPGTTYQIEGSLHLVDETGADGGVVAEGVTSLEALGTYGTAHLTFVFDAQGLDGRSVVAFETLLLDGKELACHADLSDKGQTVSFPRICTSLTDEAGIRETYASENVTLVDTVTYEGLQAGLSYEVVGSLHDKATGDEVCVAGHPVVARASFVPDASSGTVEVTFRFDATALAGKSVVAYERLGHEGIELAVHADLEDEAQTVSFPRIGTKLLGDTGTHAALAGDVTLTDHVSYERLTPGTAYVLVGALMDRTTGKPLLVDGQRVLARTDFVPDEANGTVEVSFSFDASDLASTDVVAFEELSCAGVVVARHADLDDHGQTVSFPRIETSLTSQDGTHEVHAGKVTLVDTVAYENLSPGAPYRLVGTLMDRETQTQITVDGLPLESEVAFEAGGTNGETEVTFTFDATDLAGHDLVCFEHLYMDENLVATHADISDEGQTVHVSVPEEASPSDESKRTMSTQLPNTGDVALPWAELCVAGIVIFALGLAARMRSTDRWRR